MTRSEAATLALRALEALDTAFNAALPLPGNDADEAASHLRVARDHVYSAYRRLNG